MGVINDWVEIPAGEFIKGNDHTVIRARLRQELGLTDPTEVQLFEQVLERTIALNTSDSATRYFLMRDHPLPPEAVAIGNRFAWLLKMEEHLNMQPPLEIARTKTYYISRFPITAAQMRAFDEVASQRGIGTHWFSVLDNSASIDQPAETFYYTALDYCRWMGGRLPTNLEWEKAARGVEGYLYPWGNDWDESRGDFLGNSLNPVDRYPEAVSPFGVWDMCGNGREWTSSVDSRPSVVRRGNFIVKSDSPSVYFHPDSLEYGYDIFTGRPAWFFNLMGREQYLFHKIQPHYITFRVVKDQWDTQVWPGFRAMEA